jgi:hypothetical protein
VWAVVGFTQREDRDRFESERTKQPTDP